jgi:Flp pilus assembly protein TadG
MMRRRPRSHGDEAGASLVEFALVAPVAFMLLFGLFSACWLFYQSSAIGDGATAGARAASIETGLVSVPVGSNFCESNLPTPIEAAVAKAAPALKVNNARLCTTSGDNTGPLTQSFQANSAAITVTCTPGCAVPTKVTVTVNFTGHGIAPPLNLTYPMHASSQVPILIP